MSIHDLMAEMEGLWLKKGTIEARIALLKVQIDIESRRVEKDEELTHVQAAAEVGRNTRWSAKMAREKHIEGAHKVGDKWYFWRTAWEAFLRRRRIKKVE